jgi:hypothetical protein
MNEARLILPQSVDGTPLEHRLTDLFGGYTQTIGSGGWRDFAGLTSREPVNIYDVAMPDSCASLESLAGLIGWLFATTTEHAIYCRLPGGQVVMPTRADAARVMIPWDMTKMRLAVTRR